MVLSGNWGVQRSWRTQRVPGKMRDRLKGELCVGSNKKPWKDFQQKMSIVRCALWSSFQGSVKVAPRGGRLEAGTHWGSS